jgi:hypothetical protein
MFQGGAVQGEESLYQEVAKDYIRVDFIFSQQTGG